MVPVIQKVWKIFYYCYYYYYYYIKNGCLLVLGLKN